MDAEVKIVWRMTSDGPLWLDAVGLQGHLSGRFDFQRGRTPADCGNPCEGVSSGPMNGGATGYSVGWMALSLINAGLAQGKNRSGLAWWLISLPLGPIATLLIVVLPPLEREPSA